MLVMRRKLELKKRLLIILLFIVVTAAWSVEIHEEAGTTAAAFLKIDSGTRPMAMGGAFTGLANDINTLFWNPAGLTSIEFREFSAMQNFSIADINSQAIGYAQRLNQKMAFGIGFQGAFTQIEYRAQPTDKPDDLATVGGFATGLTLAYELIPEISIGGTAKLIHQRLSVENSLGFAGDFGMVLRPMGNLMGLGMSLQHFGLLDTEEDLPMTARAGISFAPLNELSVVGDVNYPLVGDFPSVHGGLEYWFYDLVAFRIGYSLNQGESLQNGLTTGIGLRRDGRSSLINTNFQFDYALVPSADIGNAHRIAILGRF